MKRVYALFLALLTAIAPFEMRAQNIFEYQNYNHGYCPECHCSPCRCGLGGFGPMPPPPPPPVPPTAAYAGPDCNSGQCPPQPRCEAVPQPEQPIPPAVAQPCQKPCAPACGAACGVSITTLGVVVAAIAIAAVIIVTSGNGREPHTP